MTEDIITTLVGALLSAVGFFAMRWLEHINKKLDEHEKLIEELSKKIAELERSEVTKQDLEALVRKKDEEFYSRFVVKNLVDDRRHRSRNTDLYDDNDY